MTSPSVRLRAWSRRRVLLVSAGWVLGCLAALFVARESLVRRTLAASEATAAARARAVPPGQREAFLPPERGDVYVVLPRGTAAGLAAVIFGPPAILLLVWSVARARSREPAG